VSGDGLDNKVICPEDTLRVVLRAGDVPNHATVSKVRGETKFTLVHNLKVYPYNPPKGESPTPMVVEGIFMLGPRGGVTQVRPDQQLCWMVTAEDLIDCLQTSWSTEQ
jgi:hypothetical protein